MMQKIIPLSLVFAALCGCSERMKMEVDSSYPMDGIIKVSVKPLQRHTRAGVESLDDLTQFHLSVHNAANARYSYSNIEMRKENGLLTAYKDQEPFIMFWENSLSAVDIISSTLPTNELNQPVCVSVMADQSDINVMKKADFLYFKSERFIPEMDLVNGKIPIRFTHMCAKLICTVTLDESHETIDKVAVRGTALTGLFHFAEGKWKENPNLDFEIITPYKVGELPATSSVGKKITYECILIPQTISRLGFEFTINNRYFHFYTPQKLTLKENSTYELQLNIS